MSAPPWIQAGRNLVHLVECTVCGATTGQECDCPPVDSHGHNQVHLRRLARARHQNVINHSWFIHMLRYALERNGPLFTNGDQPTGRT